MDMGKFIAEGEPERLKREWKLRAVVDIELTKPAAEALKLVEPYAHEAMIR